MPSINLVRVELCKKRLFVNGLIVIGELGFPSVGSIYQLPIAMEAVKTVIFKSVIFS